MRTKIIFSNLIIALLFGVTTTRLNAQKKHSSKEKLYLIETYDGAKITGRIISSSPEKLVILNKDNVEIPIPIYQIKSKDELKAAELSKDGEYIAKPLFPSRYFITTNAFSIGQGEKYLKMNLFGPEFQYGVNDHFDVGLMATWVFAPIIMYAKYSIPISNWVSVAVGVLGLSGSWPDLNTYGAISYGMLTLGNIRRNVNIGLGYGWATNINFFLDKPIPMNGALASFGGTYQISSGTVFLFNSYLFTGIGTNYRLAAFVLPGFRVDFKKSAFQIHFLGALVNGDTYPLPIPFPGFIMKL